MSNDLRALITDVQIDRVWGNANFGNTPKREVIFNALHQIAGNFATGHTAECIVKELRLVGVKDTLTKKGAKYLYYAIEELQRPTEPTKIAEDDTMLLIAGGQLLGYYLSSCGTSITEVVSSMGLERGEWEKLSGRVNLKDADRQEIEEYFLLICDDDA